MWNPHWDITYLVEPIGALQGSSKEVFCVTLKGASINTFQGLFTLLGPWPFTSGEVELTVGILETNVPPMTVRLSCFSHLQTLNIKQ